MKAEDRDEPSQFILDCATSEGVAIMMMPNGEAMLCYHPNYRGLVYNNEQYLGNMLAALIVDGGGTWTLKQNKE